MSKTKISERRKRSDKPTQNLGPRPDTTEDTSGAPAEVTTPEPRRERPEIGDFPFVSPDNYAMGAEFARGGLGKISQALDKRLDRVIALKELHVTKPAIEARFAREIQITARLQHPNIVPVHEAGRWPSGAPFFAMKLVEGRSLAEAIKEARTLEDRLHLLHNVIAVAEAMAYSHTEGVIHRDLKPHNVLLGPFGETVVIDWGLAKDLRQAEDEDDDLPESIGEGDERYATTDGAVMGTPAYMPPEQAFGDPVDERADVYSLGALLYHLLVGSAPYVREGVDDVIERVREGPPTPIEEIEPHAPPELIAIATKAMSYLREDRYPSAREMAEELRRYATGKLVAAYHYSPWDLLRRWVARNRAAFVTAVLGVTLLTALAIWSYAEILEERNVAQSRLADHILESARAALDRDPTQAAALLKQLDAELPGAASVAAAAEQRGVARRVLKGHKDQVQVVTFAPDGKLLASGGHDHTVRLWDVESGRERVIEGHTDRVTSLGFSPEGTYVVSGGYDGKVRVTEVASSSTRELGGRREPVKAVRFSPDGRLLAAVSSDAVTVWDGLTFEERMVSHTRGDRHLSAVFSPGSEALATASHDNTIRVWDIRALTFTELAGHTGMVTSIAFAPDGSLLASGSEDRSVRLWNRYTGQRRIIAEHGAEVTAVAFSPDGQHVASGGNDDRIQVWTRGPREKTEDEPRVLSGHSGAITALAFTDDGALVSASWDGSVRVWRIDSGDAVAVLVGHDDVVSSISTIGEQLATGSWDKEVRIWRLDAARPRVLRGHTNGVHGVDTWGRWIASGGHDDTVRVWNPALGESRALTGHTDHIFRVRFSPDGSVIASSSDDRTVRLWSTETWEATVLSGHEADVEELAFSPDGARLASASEDDTVRVWDVASGRELHVLAGHQGPVTDLAFSGDGSHLASSSKDGTARWWDLRGGTSKVFNSHDAEVDGVDVSVEGWVATASEDGTVQLWHPDTDDSRVVAELTLPWRVRFAPDGLLLAVAGLGSDAWVCDLVDISCQDLVGHTARVWDVTFAPDGRALVTGSADATVRIWDTTTGESREMSGHGAAVFDIDVTDDGSRVVSASRDTTVRTWPLRLPPSPDGLGAWLDRLTNLTTRPAASRRQSD